MYYFDESNILVSDNVNASEYLSFKQAQILFTKGHNLQNINNHNDKENK